VSGLADSSHRGQSVRGGTGLSGVLTPGRARAAPLSCWCRRGRGRTRGRRCGRSWC